MTFFDNFILDNAVASRTVLDLNTFLRKGYPDSIQVATGEIALMKSLHAGKLELTKPNVVITDAAGVVAGVDFKTGGKRNIGLIHPLVPRGVVTSKMGHRPGMHWGADIQSPGARGGAKVVAVASGVVTFVQPNNVGAGGRYVLLRHDDGLHSTVYMHLASVAVKVRQTVKQGQLLGIEGRSGRVTGPHLHFEVRIANAFYMTNSSDAVSATLLSQLPYTPAPDFGYSYVTSAQNPALYLP